MSEFNLIKQPIAAELKTFEAQFRLSMKTDVRLLDKVMSYIVKRKGKQVRPMFVLYAAKICGGITDASYRGASLVELLHTATLVHDDVVDDSDQRRGFFSINALWKNKIAVLVGDFLLAKGLLLAVNNDDFRMLKLVSNAVQEMSEGELLQIEKARRLNITEEIYFEVIRKKTASLIASCCAVGAASAGADEIAVENMRKFGELIGTVFQLKDDLLDFAENTGKPTGIDIKEKKMTLPVIYLLNNSDRSTRSLIINTIKRHSDDKKRVGELVKMIMQGGGVEYTQTRMKQLKNEALQLLHTFPEIEARQMLERLTNFVMERNK